MWLAKYKFFSPDLIIQFLSSSSFGTYPESFLSRICGAPTDLLLDRHLKMIRSTPKMIRSTLRFFPKKRDWPKYPQISKAAWGGLSPDNCCNAQLTLRTDAPKPKAKKKVKGRGKKRQRKEETWTTVIPTLVLELSGRKTYKEDRVFTPSVQRKAPVLLDGSVK